MPERVPEQAVPDAGPPVVQAVAPAPRRGRHARPASDEPTAAAPESAADAVDPDVDVDVMLALLAADSTRPLGSVSQRLQSPGQRTAVMLGGLVLVAMAMFVLMTVVGAFL